jgi:hypothetical protein
MPVTVTLWSAPEFTAIGVAMANKRTALPRARTELK